MDPYAKFDKTVFKKPELKDINLTLQKKRVWRPRDFKEEQ